jgi:hypothetical protein
VILRIVVLSEAPINVAGLAAVVTAGIFTLENVDVNQHNKKARDCLALNCWLPVLDEIRNFLVSGEGAIMAEQIKHFNISLE